MALRSVDGEASRLLSVRRQAIPIYQFSIDPGRYDVEDGHVKEGKMVSRRTQAGGYTLIELIIVVTVIGIIASIAIPSYQNYTTRSRRAEAQSYMMEIALREEKYRANNSTYVDHATLPDGVANTAYYVYTIAIPDANSYTITATAKPGSTQAARDASCSPLTLTQRGVKGAPTAGCWKS